jgi:hypothetical protein
MPIMESKAKLGTVEKVQNDDFWVSKYGCMRKPVLFLMAALGLTASALSSYATTVNVTDVFNLTGQGPQLISNNGGGNQHQQSKDPVFAFNGGDLPRIIFQRLQFSSQPSDYSYLQIYKGTVTKNQVPPNGAPIIIGSSAVGPNPPDFLIDFGAANNAASQQIQAILLADPTSVYTIAVVEVNVTGNTNNPKLNYTTRGSVQFQFPNLKVINGQLSLNFNITTQLGND